MTVYIDGNQSFGDGTNYSYFDSKGVLNNMRDARVKVASKVFTQSELQYGISPPSASTIGNFQTSSYTIEDDSLLSSAILSRRDPTADIEVIIRWTCNEAYATNSGEIQWQIGWAVAPDDGSTSLDNPTYFGTVKSEDINIPTTAKTIQETTLIISGANITDDDELGIKLKRIAIDDGVNPTAEPEIQLVALMDITNKLGEKL